MLRFSNFASEGIAERDITVVGSTAIDAARAFAPRAQGRTIVAESLCRSWAVARMQPYLTCTVHRAENTTPEVLPGLLRGLSRLAEQYPLLWPVHPRTRRLLDELKLPLSPADRAAAAGGYLDMLALLSDSLALCTDSGGLQEESYALGTPVLILRNETEWSYLVDGGCATLLGNREDDVVRRGLASLVDCGKSKDASGGKGADGETGRWWGGGEDSRSSDLALAVATAVS
jgi:UDP-N-acetylglucosamine 2-epimerase